MNINDMVARCYNQARNLGWADDSKPVPIPEQIALIHSEASEALEAWREKQPQSWTDEKGKPQGLASEYADIIIRIGHYAAALEIDLEYEIERKLQFNATREYRHGGKLA